MSTMVRLTVRLWLLVVLMSTVALVWGNFQTMPRSIREFHLNDCQPPCWIGIIPGVTAIAEAKTQLVTTFGGQSGLRIKDAGFADGNVLQNAVENTIEGADFSLYVRLGISELVDGKTEIVQSIGLFESRPDRRIYAPTIRDILGTFGAPRLFADEETLGLGREVTLRYEGMDVVYFARVDRLPFDEIPRFYLGDDPSPLPDSEFHPWTWISTFAHG